MNFLINTGPGIGDMLQKLPMARALKEEYPDANIDFIMPGKESHFRINTPVIECQHYVRHLYWYNSDAKFHSLKLLLQLRMNHYDYGFVRDGGMATDNVVPSFWIFRIMRWGGCKKLVGFLKDYVDVHVDVPARVHYLERDRLTLNAVGVHRELNAETIDVSLTDNSIFDSFRPTRKLIALSVGTNAYTWTENGKTIVYDVKSWPYENWLKLAAELSENGYDTVLIGGRKEANEMSERGINIPESEHIFSFIGRTTLKQSLALLSRCVLVVGAEGGMMHCAAGMGIKTLTVFGGSDYRQWRPAGGEIVNLNLECSPCYATIRGAECTYHKCLEGISPEMVFEKIQDMEV